jgi:hypothetical protein
MDTPVLVALISAFFSLGSAIITGLLLRLTSARENEIGEIRRKGEKNAEHFHAMNERMHELDKETIRLQGRLALHERNQSETDKKLDELRLDVETGFSRIEDRLERALKP